MKRLLSLALLLALVPCVRAEDPTKPPAAPPDYHALYLAANDAAAKWKAAAEQMQEERDLARRERDGARRQVTPVPLGNTVEYPLSNFTGNNAPGVRGGGGRVVNSRSEITLSKKQHILVPGLNQWVTFYGADALAVHMSIGPGNGTRQDFPMRRGLEGSGNNETTILTSGGKRLIYVDTVRSHGDSGVFVIESSDL